MTDTTRRRIADAIEHFWQSGYMPELIASFRAEGSQVFVEVGDALEGHWRRGEMSKVIAVMMHLPNGCAARAYPQ